MFKLNKKQILIIVLSCLLTFDIGNFSSRAFDMTNTSSHLLSDPFLQLPTDNSVNVVWFTEFEGDRSYVSYGGDLEKTAKATTTKLSRTREDEQSFVATKYDRITPRDIWRHEAIVEDLKQNDRIPYQVTTIDRDKAITSKTFSLTTNPTKDKPLKILLTSDHQLMPMTTANLQKVVETVGIADAVFLAGDLVNIPDRASEWFDDSRGGAFFPALQGKGNYPLAETIYHGGEIIQHTPLFTAIGNHEVMGRFSTTESLKHQFKDAIPRSVAKNLLKQTDNQEEIKNNSFNTDTYEEIFSLPESKTGREKYYAISFGNIRLVVLYVTNIWRVPSTKPSVKGRYQESVEDLNSPEKWGYGQHIFEPINEDSQQYNWLKNELESKEFQNAEYKIVMFHHPPHTLGSNIVPPFTNPQQVITKDENGKVTSVKYEYSIDRDYIIRDLIPLLENAGVQLIYYGHSHLWNRFLSPSGLHFLESSNVGNSYGAHLEDNLRKAPADNPNYKLVGDPNGLEPIAPNITPLQDEKGNDVPYIASNQYTVFSILDTQTGTVSSYRFDTQKPQSEVVKFDEFSLK